MRHSRNYPSIGNNQAVTERTSAAIAVMLAAIAKIRARRTTAACSSLSACSWPAAASRFVLSQARP